MVYAFEDEIMAFILATEKAHEFGWNNIWVELDSLYVVNLYKYNIEKIPWLLLTQQMENSSEISQRSQCGCFSHLPGGQLCI